MKILAINPGSTSTKIGVYEDKKSLFQSTIRHSLEELSVYSRVSDQFEFRISVVVKELKTNHIPIQFDAVIGRGGIIKPIPSGVYEVNTALVNDLIHASRDHASNLGGLIALELALLLPGCKAFIADPVVVDELDDIARISGSPLLPRLSIFHALNQKAIARRYAYDYGLKYEDLNLIVCHLGGGISVAAHRHGRIIDVNNAFDGEGPFAPERAGTLPAGQLVNLCFSGTHTQDEILKMLTGRAGVAAHLGTTDMVAIEERVANGDKDAELVFNAMIYNAAKAIGSMAVVLSGQADAILLTGGMAYSGRIVSCLKEYISFLCGVHVYPGEDELGALAANALGAFTGEFPVKEYI